MIAYERTEVERTQRKANHFLIALWHDFLICFNNFYSDVFMLNVVGVESLLFCQYIKVTRDSVVDSFGRTISTQI